MEGDGGLLVALFLVYHAVIKELQFSPCPHGAASGEASGGDTRGGAGRKEQQRRGDERERDKEQRNMREDERKGEE